MAKKKAPQRMWMPRSTQRNSKAPLSDSIKADLNAKAAKMVENVLKPRYVQPPPKEPRFNYIIDVWTKWHGSTLYFGATFACPGPNAMSPSFESKVVRMEHIGGGRFALSYMRHNEKWFKLFLGLTIDECLDAIENDGHFAMV